jgi:hypothetical protein
MFNFYTFYKFLIISVVWVIYSGTLLQLTDLYYNFGDLSTRLWVNEFFMNTYYFYWTSFWYLTVVVIMVKLVFILVYVRTLNFNLLVFTYLLIVYSMITFEYWGYNYSTTDLLKPEYQINSLLTNSINKYHPFIFYFTLTWIYVVNLYITSVFYKQTFRSNYQKLYLVRNLGFFLPLIYSTLALGSWWALQEGSWGGWWNWDSSEVFGLLVMLFYLHVLHKSFTSLTCKNVKMLSNLFLYTLVFIYALIQLNFDLVSHNFGTKINQFINSDQLFYIILTITFVFILYKSILQLNQSNEYLLNDKTQNFNTIRLLFTLLTLTIVLLSFTELINNFFWLLLKTNLLNIINLTSYYTPLTLIILYLLMTRTNIIFMCVFSYLTCYVSTLYLLCISVSNKTWVYGLHVVIYLFILCTCNYLNQSLIDWHYILNNNYFLLSKSLVDVNNTFLKLNTTYIEILSVDLIDNQLISAGWNFIQWSTNPQVHTFKHDLLTTLTSQGLYSSLLEYIHSICVVDYSSQVLGLLTFLLIILFFKARKYTLTILF